MEKDNEGRVSFGGSQAGAGGTLGSSHADAEGDLTKTYVIGDRQREDLDNRFRYHAPRPDQIPRYNAIREKARELAYLIATVSPVSREQSTAFTLLDEAVMQANAAIARNEP